MAVYTKGSHKGVIDHDYTTLSMTVLILTGSMSELNIVTGHYPESWIYNNQGLGLCTSCPTFQFWSQDLCVAGESQA